MKKFASNDDALYKEEREVSFFFFLILVWVGGAEEASGDAECEKDGDPGDAGTT